MTIWVMIHIPKCGGLTLRNAIEENAGQENLHIFADTHLQGGERHPAQDERDADWETRIVPVLDGAKKGKPLQFVYGHFQVDRVIPWLHNPAIRLGTIIRDPIERLLSHYYWWQRWPDPAHPACVELHEKGMGVMEFGRHPAMKNALSYFLGGVPFSRWDYIGFVDGTRDGYLLRVLGLLSAMTGLGIAAEPDHANQNTGRITAAYPLDGGLRAELQGYHAEDMKLFNQMVARHQAMVGAMA